MTPAIPPVNGSAPQSFTIAKSPFTPDPSSGLFGVRGGGFGGFGSSSDFGQTTGQKGLFGTIPSTQSGAKGATGSVFDQTTKDSSSPFGTAQTPNPASFGSSSRPFGPLGPSVVFNPVTSQESPFGFGMPKSTTSGVNGDSRGTGTVPFRPYTERDPPNSFQMSHYQSISFREPYRKSSFEVSTGLEHSRSGILTLTVNRSYD